MTNLPNFKNEKSAAQYSQIFSKKLASQHTLVSAVAEKYLGKPEGGITTEQLGLMIEVTKGLMDETYSEWWDAQFEYKEEVEKEEETPCSTGQCPV